MWITLRPKDEVSILLQSFQHSTREYYATGIRATRIKTAPTHASADWYVENLLPVVTLRFVAKYRQVIWQGRVLNSQLTDEELRNKDEEIGLLLSALGFTTNTKSTKQESPPCANSSR